MTWVLALAGLALLLIVLWRVGKRPTSHPVRSPHDLLRAFTSFEVGASPGALLFIGHQQSGRLLQFVRNEAPGRQGAISFGFPEVEWSANLYAPMRSALEGAGFAIVERSGTNGTRFLDVDDLTVPHAVTVAHVALGVLGFAALEDLRTYCEGPVRPVDLSVYDERLREYAKAPPHA